MTGFFYGKTSPHKTLHDTFTKSVIKTKLRINLHRIDF